MEPHSREAFANGSWPCRLAQSLWRVGPQGSITATLLRFLQILLLEPGALTVHGANLDLSHRHFPWCREHQEHPSVSLLLPPHPEVTCPGTKP
jgi:hypothetical protein